MGSSRIASVFSSSPGTLSLYPSYATSSGFTWTRQRTLSCSALTKRAKSRRSTELNPASGAQKGPCRHDDPRLQAPWNDDPLRRAERARWHGGRAFNAVEGFFAKFTMRRLKRGVFFSVADLQAAISRFLADHNGQAKPFTWTADPEKIIAAVRRGHQALDSIH